MTGFLLDENITPELFKQLQFHLSGVPLYMVGVGIAPPKQTPDPDILIWLEAHDCILVTHNRRSMPVHLAAHLVQGHHVPGIVLLHQWLPIGVIVADLALIAGASLPGEYQDRFEYLPLRR